ncbi:Predicted flavoprotein CzcO associated with the cation diffusion facilitator CzcD [Parasphingorhabdus marina DSM 22363]|uniref:Predicted flavoprotein CzcO associated with the cation diffusion facilitator CzcD n=1 Tax=Parasphingorhabdus marina DSM 22363 TaxID=1123272 RepID=A0A1N6CX04_9SPHN|nr:NAD(P)/FAD-dependent oxidoreductase [Parasphingorhabdus marina]SIN63029.1 Predicted flavoprotein CzcO associated with the cation diffusion facilitator CzcD [Parasphingorhabdus marina DSM 22363]
MATHIAENAGAELEAAPQSVDVLIVGAGISGIGMAVHLRNKCPGKSFALLERRDDIGGTWNLFQYPGIRSDSDMHTLGFNFEPWTEQKAIADGPSIINYLHRIKAKHDLEKHIHFGHKVLSASWSSEDARWTVTAEKADGSTTVMQAGFIYMGAGYYDYDNPYDAQIEGLQSFKGDVLHPQFWPQDYDYAGKKVVIIGSGATAVTIVPVMAETAEHVTMLQRTPTWYAARPAKDWLANTLRKIMPESWAYKIIRKKNVWMQDLTFRTARDKPEKVIKKLEKPMKRELGDKYNKEDYTPPYGPWEQRLCLVPDSDMFKAIASGKADVKTGHIETVTETGVKLKSGEELEADIIVTATGLKLAVAGKVAFEVDGKPIHWPDHYYYKGCMFSDIPNMAIVFGYLNASWTLKADIVSEYVCRVINHMDATSTRIANPKLESELEQEELFDFSSGYIRRSINELPRNSTAMPWKLNQDYLFDKKVLLNEPVDDGVMRFYGPNSAGNVADAGEALEAAE